MDEVKKEEIRKQAKRILDEFSKSLSKVNVNVKKSIVESEFREEKHGGMGNEDFRERMFANATNKEGDFIIAEKKKW